MSDRTPCSGCALVVDGPMPRSWFWDKHGRVFCPACARERRLDR